MVNYNTILIKRGAFMDMGTLQIGELCICTDTKQVFIGTGTGNVELLLAGGVFGSMGTQSASNVSITGGSITGVPSSYPITEKTGAYTASAADTTIICNATGGSFVITLPTAIGIGGKIYVIKKTDASANTVTVDGNASETIDVALTKVITKRHEFIMIQSDNANWQIISSYEVLPDTGDALVWAIVFGGG